MQIVAENRRFSQETAENRRNPQIGVCPLRSVPLSPALNGVVRDGVLRQVNVHDLGRRLFWQTV